MTFTVERTADEVLTIRHNDVSAGWEQWYLLTSDWHRDNPKFRADLFHRTMKEAQRRNAGIFVFGDAHDAMQGKDDPRRSYGDLVPAITVEDYFDALEDDFVAEVQPYADSFVMMSEGNHETAPKRKNGINLVKRVARRIGCQHMGWAGWVKFMFSNGDGKRTSRNLWFEHGSGGGGKSGRGIQYASYRAAYLPDADIIASGHIHWTWVLPLKRHRLRTNSKTGSDIQWHCSLPTFKDEFTPMGGYHMEKGREPRPIGAIWLRFYYDANAHTGIGTELRLAVE